MRTIAAVDDYVRSHPAVKLQLGQMAAKMIETPRAAAVRNQKVREKLKEWAKLAPAMRRGSDRMQSKSPGPGPSQDPQVRVLLRPLISKTATDEEVAAAAGRIEEYAKKNPVARGQIGDICRRIIAADKLSNYGTPKCQESMKKWAQEFLRPAASAGAGKKSEK